MNNGRNMESGFSDVSQEDKIHDKTLYSIGDKSASGLEIATIYNCSRNYLIYCSPNGYIGWEAEDYPNWAAAAFTECRRLRGIAESYLSRRHIPIINRLLADALSSSISSEEGVDVVENFKEAKRYIEKYKDEIKSIIATGPDFQIYRTNKNTVHWHHRKLPSHLNQAVEEFESLHSLANSVLPNSSRLSTSRMLGSALSVSFRKSEKENLSEIFEGPKKFILSQADSHLRIRLFLVSFLFTITFLLLLLASSYAFDLKTLYVSGAAAGVLGAMVSALQRNNKISIDPYGSVLGLYSESISRLVVGVIFGVFVIFCAKSELALAPFKENLYALVCFSFAAGFTERFVPDLMTSVIKNSGTKVANN